MGDALGIEDFAGFGISGYRSFGDPDSIARIGPMSKVHLVVGQNNVGKSNALRFLMDYLPRLTSVMEGRFVRREDEPEAWPGSSVPTLSVGFHRTPAVVRTFHLEDDYPSAWLSEPQYSPDENGAIWIDFELNGSIAEPSVRQLEAAIRSHEGALEEPMIRALSSQYSNSNGTLADDLRSIIRAWNPLSLLPKVEFVNAVRELTSSGDSGFLDGRGLISALAAVERPAMATYGQDKATWENLQRFIRDVLDDENAQIEIPDAKNTINVTTRNGIRELHQVGTGISELIFIAALASTRSDRLICIEEPESHLHPTLQRKLIGYLSSSTNNHYLISTHSAAMLNSEIASITHLTMQEAWTVAAPVITPAQLSQAATDLGNRASDLVQSNFIIWVEGPSDRLYVRKWLQVLDPDLVEGAHFSVMFYGGALLSHLTAMDREVDDLIGLLRINRNLAILIDSDRSAVGDSINATKKRVLDEVSDSGGYVWVTDQYTIENYIDLTRLKSAVQAEYPNRSYRVPTGGFVSPLGRKFQGTNSKPSKVSVARRLVDEDWSPTDLGASLLPHLTELSDRIRLANGLPPGLVRMSSD